MAQEKHRVFISYHHKNDQNYKEKLLKINEKHEIFIDASVDTGDIDENLSDESIREKIRDEYLKNSTVTIVLVGIETMNRKHIDWEIYSSMIDGQKNKKSGVLVVCLPTTGCTYYTAAHGASEKINVYPSNGNWTSVKTIKEYETRYPYLSKRLIDNLLKKEALVSVTNWDVIENDIEKLKFLIDVTFDDRSKCEYDLSRTMRRKNS